MDTIAERELVAHFPDGETAKVFLRIGRPTPHPEGNWACPALGEGLRLWEGPTHFFGVGSWDALMNAQRFLREMLTAEIERRAVFHWEDGQVAVSVEELFVLHEIS